MSSRQSSFSSRRRERTSQRQRRRGTAGRLGPTSISNAVSLFRIPNINRYVPDQVFYLRRNLADALIAIQALAIPTVQFMPGFSGTPWVILAAPTPDISPNGTPYVAQGLSCQFTLDALSAFADIQNMFAEFRVAGVRYTFTTQDGDAGLQNVGGVIPEIWASPWPESAVPPPNPVAQEQRQCIRRCVTGLRPLTLTVAPRPAVELYESPILSGYAYMSNQETWMSATSVSTPWYAISAMIRNFIATNNSGFGIRISAEAFLECRRAR